MTDPDLPEDLASLERELAARPRPRPSDDMRDRVLSGMEANLTGAHAPVRRRMGPWEFALAAAAAILIWANLSMSAVNRMDWEADGRFRNGIETAVALVQELVPELSEAEARRQVLLLKAAERLVRAPKPARPRPRITLPDA
jgi:hypothetical protein